MMRSEARRRVNGGVLRVGAAAVLLLAACTWRFQRVEGEPPSIPSSLWQSADCLRNELRATDYPSCEKAFAPHVYCDGTPSLCARGLDGTSALPASASVAFSFVHLGDADVRERALVYWPKPYNALSLDNRWRRHSDAAVAGVVAAANGLPEKPRFLLHTGNAVGTGLFSELMRFIAAMNVAQMPWFNAIGPRDAAFMGDKPLESVSQLNVVAPYVPIGNAYRFMKYHSRNAAVEDPSMPFVAGRLDYNVPDAGALAMSDFHGFDFACTTASWCAQMHGYYAFDVPTPAAPELKFRVLVLNTSEALEDDGSWGSSRGHLLRAQLEWLRNEVSATDGGQRYLVFGHHALDEIDGAAGAQLREALTGSPAVLAYFHGGEKDAFDTLARPGGGALPMLGAGSLQRYPQTARLVEVLRDGDALYLRVRAFSQFNDVMTDDAGAHFMPANEGGADPDYPQQTGCIAPSEGTSFCYRLTRTAGDSRAAARALFDGQLEAVLRSSNGVVRVH